MMTIYFLVMGYCLLSALSCAISQLVVRPKRWSAQANIAPLIVMGAIAAAKGIMSFFKNKGQNDQAEKAAELENAARQGNVDAAQQLMDMAKQAGFDPFAPQTTTSQQAGQYGGTSSSRTRETSEQHYTPYDAALDKALQRYYMDMIETPAITKEMAAAQEANRMAAAQKGAVAERNFATRRNVSPEEQRMLIETGPAMTAARTDIGNQFIQNALQNRAAREGAIGAANQFATARGGQAGSRDSRTTGSTSGWSSGTSSTTAPPSMSNIMGMYNLLATARGGGMAGPQAMAQTTNPWLSAGSDAASTFGQLYAANQGGGGIAALMKKKPQISQDYYDPYMEE